MTGSPTLTVRLLGTAQDGGIPHFGCRCVRCETARRDPSLRRTAASLVLVDDASGEALLLDPSPDLAHQTDAWLLDDPGRPGLPVSAVAVTHVHWGHWIGLGLFGREVAAARQLPVVTTQAVGEFLRNNAPTQHAVLAGHIVLKRIESENADGMAVGPFHVRAFQVPHRAEYADVVAFRVEHPASGSRVLWCPDIDAWPRPGEMPDLPAVAADCNLAFVDATFGGPTDLPAHRMARVPHPLADQTMAAFRPAVEAGCGVALIHFNHTNALADPGSDLARRAQAGGFLVPPDGEWWRLPHTDASNNRS